MGILMIMMGLSNKGYVLSSFEIILTFIKKKKIPALANVVVRASTHACKGLIPCQGHLPRL